MPKPVGQPTKYKREDFIRAAMRLFLDKGYEETTVVDILESASNPPASPSVFYHYFQSKADLYEIVLQRCADDYLLALSTEQIEPFTVEAGEREIIRMLVVMTRFYFACHRLGTMKGSAPRSMGDDMLAYLGVRNEKIIANLIRLLPWKGREGSTGTLPQMVTGGILQVAGNLLHRRAPGEEERPILLIAMDVAQHILMIANSPEDSRLRIMAGFDAACAQLFAESEQSLRKNAGRILSAPEALDLLRDLSYLADMVRLVDPKACEVLVLESEGTITRSARCFDTWGICDRCGNCIGAQAVDDCCRYEKYEMHDRLVYHITAIPITLQCPDQASLPCVVESCSITSAENWLKHIESCAPISDLIKMNSQVYEDSLTKVCNRRFFDERAFCPAILQHGAVPVSFLLCDLRDFKHINDAFGHSSGDKVLAAAAEGMKSAIRSTDMIIRIGGDEFLIILPGCREEKAQSLAENIAARVAERTAEAFDGCPVLLDIGTAGTDAFTGDGEQIRALFALADERMYANKQQAKKTVRKKTPPKKDASPKPQRK